MSVTIDEMNVEVAPAQAPASTGASQPQGNSQPDLRKTLMVIKERMQRLSAK